VCRAWKLYRDRDYYEKARTLAATTNLSELIALCVDDCVLNMTESMGG
jgi:hypothetical protein